MQLFLELMIPWNDCIGNNANEEKDRFGKPFARNGVLARALFEVLNRKPRYRLAFDIMASFTIPGNDYEFLHVSLGIESVRSPYSMLWMVVHGILEYIQNSSFVSSNRIINYLSKAHVNNSTNKVQFAGNLLHLWIYIVYMPTGVGTVVPTGGAV